jgi:hypothetical protein
MELVAQVAHLVLQAHLVLAELVEQLVLQVVQVQAEQQERQEQQEHQVLAEQRVLQVSMVYLEDLYTI